MVLSEARGHMAISGYPTGHTAKWVTRCQARGADLIDWVQCGGDFSTTLVLILPKDQLRL